VTSEPPPLIVHVVFRFAIGGLENGVVNLVNRLPQHAWRHAIVALTDVDPVFAKRVTRDDVELISLHKRPGHAVPLYPRIYSLLRKLRPAIVHTRNLAALEAVVPAWRRESRRGSTASTGATRAIPQEPAFATNGRAVCSSPSSHAMSRWRPISRSTCEMA